MWLYSHSLTQDTSFFLLKFLNLFSLPLLTPSLTMLIYPQRSETSRKAKEKTSCPSLMIAQSASTLVRKSAHLWTNVKSAPAAVNASLKGRLWTLDTLGTIAQTSSGGVCRIKYASNLQSRSLLQNGQRFVVK